MRIDDAISKDLDGLDNLKNISLELALKKVEEGRADPVEMAKKLGIGLEEFEEIAVERGIMDGILDCFTVPLLLCLDVRVYKKILE